jgi:hypothetical protein
MGPILVIIAFILKNKKCNSNKGYSTKGCYVELRCHCQLLTSETIAIMLCATRSLMMVASISAITLNMQNFLPNFRIWEVCKVHNALPSFLIDPNVSPRKTHRKNEELGYAPRVATF